MSLRIHSNRGTSCSKPSGRLPSRLASVRARTAQPTRTAPELDQPVEDILSAQIPDTDVLNVPNIRHKLQEYDSPFCGTNNRGGGCAVRTFSANCPVCTPCDAHNAVQGLKGSVLHAQAAWI